MGDSAGWAGGRTEVFVMLTEQKLIGHAGDVIAHDEMTWVAAGQLFE